MLSYYTLFLGQSDIASFEDLFNNIIIIIRISLFIENLIMNASIYSILMWHSLQLIKNYFIRFTSITLEVNCTMGLKTG